jgi:hypothetical protein
MGYKAAYLCYRYHTVQNPCASTVSELVGAAWRYGADNRSSKMMQLPAFLASAPYNVIRKK